MNLIRQINRAITEVKEFWKWCADSFKDDGSNSGKPQENNEQAPNKRTDSSRLKWPDAWKEWFEIAGIIAGIAVAVLIYLQYREMTKTTRVAIGQMNVMQGQLDEAKRTRVLDERAWVTLYSLERVEAGTDMYFRVNVKNSGKTPAVGTTIWLGATPDINFAKRFNPTNIIEKSIMLSPGDTGTLDTASRPVPIILIPPMQFFKIHMYVYGEIKYKDIFGNTHWTRFCREAVGDFDSFTGTTVGDSCDDFDTNQQD
jgi:hypothetical protein